MQIQYYKRLDSTQIYLKEQIKQNIYKGNICIYTFNQTNGIGSRDNNWYGEDGNLYFSFSFLIKDLPKDLPIQSVSLYFSYLLKELLANNGSKLFLKWPNDFYINDYKIGGTVTHKLNDYIICGIGLNIKKNKNYNGYLDIDIMPDILLENYFKLLNKYPTWNEVFSKYKVEFQYSKNYNTHIKGKIVSLKDAILCDDGSLIIDKERVFSLR